MTIKPPTLLLEKFICYSHPKESEQITLDYFYNINRKYITFIKRTYWATKSSDNLFNQVIYNDSYTNGSSSLDNMKFKSDPMFCF